MTKEKRISIFAVRFGLLGTFGLMIGIIIALFIELKNGTTQHTMFYSLSQLGTYARSSSAVILNGGLFFGSLSVALACLFAVQVRPSFWGSLFWLSFALMFIALAATGLFPVNVYHLHIVALSVYITMGVMCSFYFFGYCIKMSMPYRLIGLFFASLLMILQSSQLLAPQYTAWVNNREFVDFKMVVDSITAMTPTPEIWWQAIAMWVSVVCILALLLISLRHLYELTHIGSGS